MIKGIYIYFASVVLESWQEGHDGGRWDKFANFHKCVCASTISLTQSDAWTEPGCPWWSGGAVPFLLQSHVKFWWGGGIGTRLSQRCSAGHMSGEYGVQSSDSGPPGLSSTKHSMN